MLLEFAVVFVVVFVPAAWFWRPSPQRIAIAQRYDGIRMSKQPLHAASLRLVRNEHKPQSKLLEHFTQGAPFKALRRLLLQADALYSVAALLCACFACALLALAMLLMAGAPGPMLLCAPLVAVSLPFAFPLMKRKRRRAAFSLALPEAVEMMARSLRAGHSMSASISVLAEHAPQPLAAEFAEVFRKQNFGVPLRESLLTMVERVASQDLRVVVTAILVQKDTGGNLAEILARTATLLRERQRLQREVQTHTAQGRITGWILCALPLVLLVVINIGNPGYSHVLFADGMGRKLLYSGLMLLAVGSLWIRSIVRGIEV